MCYICGGSCAFVLCEGMGGGDGGGQCVTSVVLSLHIRSTFLELCSIPKFLYWMSTLKVLFCESVCVTRMSVHGNTNTDTRETQ